MLCKIGWIKKKVRDFFNFHQNFLNFWGVKLWRVAHFFHSLVGGCNSKATANPTKSEWKKWATGQSCIRKRSATCKIGTLVGRFFQWSHLLINESLVGMYMIRAAQCHVWKISRSHKFIALVRADAKWTDAYHWWAIFLLSSSIRASIHRSCVLIRQHWACKLRRASTWLYLSSSRHIY